MMDEPRRRILLVLKHAGYIGVYGSLVQELAERGHSVHVAYVGADSEGEAALERLSVNPNITHGTAPHRGPLDGWASVAWLARALGDLARYSHPRFARAPALRNRMAGKVEAHLQGAGGFDPLTRRLALRRARQLHACLDEELAEQAIRKSRRLEEAIPTSRRITAFIRDRAPDVVLVSPLIDLASSLLEYLKAARQLGVPTGICVASWDNLTSKGLLRFVPERVFVWNETQRQEAVELHGIPADRVFATGAARFDDWFAQRPSASREQFMDKLGLDPAQPFLLYVCSSGFIVRDEAVVVASWIEALRNAEDERLRSIGVVVRPYPKRRKPWKGVDMSEFANVALWPPPGSVYTPAEGRSDFYDSVAHCAGVVGANTSAMLEAAIVGKPVYSVLAPEFAQTSTIHFHYLVAENGGFLHVASSLDEHLEQLGRSLGTAAEARRTRRFIEAFIRPNGLERPATPIFVDAIEELAELTPDPARETPGRIALRTALIPVVCASSVAAAAALAKAAVQRVLISRREGEAPRPRPAVRTPNVTG